MLAINLFHDISFFFERERFLYKKILFFCSPIFLAKLKQGWDKTARTKHRGIWWSAQSELTKCDLCLLCMLCKFYYLKLKTDLALSPAWTWWLYPTNLKSFLHELVHKRYASKVYGCITPKFINQNSTPCQIWLKKAV